MRGVSLSLMCLAVLLAPAMAAEKCTVELATGQAQIDTMRQQARSAGVLLPMLKELSVINAKAKDPHRSIGDQLTPQDAARFVEITAQMQSIRLSQLIRSAHARDAAAVAAMFSEAWLAYGNPAYAPKDGNVPGVALVIMRGMFPTPDTTLSSTEPDECTINSALANQERKALRRIGTFNSVLDRDAPIVDQLKRRYGISQNGSLDPDKMDPEDVRTMQRINADMQPAFRERQIAGDLENIRAWWSAAELVYQTRRKDMETYGADPNSIGKTLQADLGGMDQRTQVMVGLWMKVNERMPSEEMKMLQMTTDALKRSGQK